MSRKTKKVRKKEKNYDVIANCYFEERLTEKRTALKYKVNKSKICTKL